MPQASSRKRSRRVASKAAQKPPAHKGSVPKTGSASGTRARRPGLPAPESIQSVETFRSPKGKVYRIIKTNETDADATPVPLTSRRKQKP